MIRAANDKAVAYVRYGNIPEVARFHASNVDELTQGNHVVVRTHRGVELGELLEVKATSHIDADLSELDEKFELLRIANSEDFARANERKQQAQADYPAWRSRIDEWQLSLVLIDAEWTLDGEKLILYVLNDRGPECTKLALQAAAAGLGLIEVQPVNKEGLVALASGGGCGSCGTKHS